jgi:hypothetical protein
MTFFETAAIGVATRYMAAGQALPSDLEVTRAAAGILGAWIGDYTRTHATFTRGALIAHLVPVGVPDVTLDTLLGLYVEWGDIEIVPGSYIGNPMYKVGQNPQPLTRMGVV